MANIQRYFWWPGMHAFVKSYVQGCALCQQMKVNTHPSAPPLAPIKADPHAYLFSIVTMEFITDLPESNRYNVTNLGTYAGPLFFSPHDSFYSSFLLYLFGLPHLSAPISQTHAY